MESKKKLQALRQENKVGAHEGLPESVDKAKKTSRIEIPTSCTTSMSLTFHNHCRL